MPRLIETSGGVAGLSIERAISLILEKLLITSVYLVEEENRVVLGRRRVRYDEICLHSWA